MALYKGAALRMSLAGLRRVCDLLMCTAPQFRAVLEVEARGSGYDKQGRVLILFEPHVMWRCLPGPPPLRRGAPPPPSPERLEAQRLGLAYPSWGTRDYPKDSYPILTKAMAFDETAALKACSWGMGQVLGENHKMLGYATVQDMVVDFAGSEDAQILGMARFIAAAKLAGAMRKVDGKPANCAPLARGYNGPKYADHNYHGRIAAAFRKWTRAKDQFAVRVAKPGQTPVDQSNAVKTQAQATAGGAVAAGAGGAATATVQPTKPTTAPENATTGQSWAPVLGWAAFALVLGACAFLLWRRAKSLLPVDRFQEPHPLAA